MKYICMLVGYLLGSLNPAALLAKLKKKDLRNNGTGNYGATNTALVIGKWYGVLVMLFDMAKGYASVKLAVWICPYDPIAGLFTGCAVVLGHIFPFYMRFKGGKGLASFGGMILALSPMLFLILLTVALLMILITGYSVAMPLSATSLFPILYGIETRNILFGLIALSISALIFCKHLKNISNIRNKTELTVWEHLNHSFHSADG